VYLKIKRAFAILGALIGFILLSPVFLIVAIAIKMDSKGSVFFSQKRVGKNRRLFVLYKFRSMCIQAPSEMPTHMLEGAQSYITRVGKFLRKTSLDELPQLWNIIKGDMSAIGPRPALWNQDDLVAERELFGANGIRPGLTGWAQVNGRDELPIPIKAEYDGYYAAHVNFKLDIKIIFMTLRQTVSGKGVVEGQRELVGKDV